MKALLIIIAVVMLLFAALAQASVICNSKILYECGEKWDLQNEIGERIKHEESQKNPDRTKLEALQTEFDNLAWVKNTEFDKNSVDTIKSRLPEDAFFTATDTPKLGGVNPESGMANRGLLALLAVLTVAGGLLAFLYKKK